MFLFLTGVHRGCQHVQVLVLAEIRPGVPLREGDVHSDGADHPHRQRHHHQTVRHEQQNRDREGLAPRHSPAQHHLIPHVLRRVQVTDQDEESQRYAMVS